MEEPKKATDILLSIENKVDTLLKLASVYDLNAKIILDKTNKILALLDQNKSVPLAEKQSNLIAIDNNIIPVAESNDISARRNNRITAPVVEKPVLEQAKPTSDDPNVKKIPVIQRVTDNTGKDLFMAEVNILNSNKELVQKVKTNAAGKWQAYLKVGNYTIHIIKTDTATKNKIEGFQDIVVSDSAVTCKLPTAILNR